MKKSLLFSSLLFSSLLFSSLLFSLIFNISAHGRQPDKKQNIPKTKSACNTPLRDHAKRVNSHITIPCPQDLARTAAEKRFGSVKLLHNGYGLFCNLGLSHSTGEIDFSTLKGNVLACISTAKDICNTTRAVSSYESLFGVFCGTTESYYYWTNVEPLPSGVERVEPGGTNLELGTPAAK